MIEFLSIRSIRVLKAKAAQLSGQLIGQRTQQLRTIALPGAAVHTGQGGGLGGGQALEHVTGIFGMGEVIHL